MLYIVSVNGKKVSKPIEKINRFGYTIDSVKQGVVRHSLFK